MSSVVIRTGDTTFDKIYAYYVNPKRVELTPKQEETREIWVAAWTALLKMKSKNQVAKVLEETHGRSRAQAYRDIRRAEKLFGSVYQADRDGMMALLYQFALKGYKKSMKAKKYKEAKGFLDIMVKCVPSENGINFNPDKLDDKPDKLSMPKEVVNAIAAHLKSGVVDLNEMAVDIDYEEVDEDE